MTTQEKIIKYIVKLYANGGDDGISMRQLAGKVGVVQSVLYHYFPDKEKMLRFMFDSIQDTLEVERAKLPLRKNLSELLKQRISFQFDHAEETVAVLKYFYAYRKKFKKKSSHYLPERLYQSMVEVLEYGSEQGEIVVKDIDNRAKMMSILLYGVMFEYYPQIPVGRERSKLIQQLHSSLLGLVEAK